MVTIESLSNFLKVSYVNSSGNIELIEIPIPKSEMFEWFVPEKLEKRNYNEKFPEYKYPEDFKQYIYKKSDLKKRPTKNLNPYRIYEFLHTLPQSTQDLIFDTHYPRLFFCDIEVEITNEFPNPNNPNNQITTIALSNLENQCLVLGLKPLTESECSEIENNLNVYFSKINNDGKKIKFIYLQYKNEYEMLFNFFLQYLLKIPAITGWNFIDFDLKYLFARAKRLNINPEICSISRKLYTNENIPMHKIVFDYLELYKRWYSNMIKESNSLDWVANKLLGVKKFKFSQSLTELYNSNYKNYVYYNVIDSLLVRFIHQKIHIFDILLKLSQILHIETIKAKKSLYTVEMALLQQLLKKGYILLHRKEDFDEDTYKKDKYQGAYVSDPIPGLYQNIAVFDYTSLYPTIIRQWNISPEIFVGKDLKLSKQEIRDKKLIKTINNYYFDGSEEGALNVLLTSLFNQRKEANLVEAEIEKEIHYLKKLQRKISNL